MRTKNCPICGSDSAALLELQFGPKSGLPASVPVRYCADDDFAFVAAGDQAAYNEYYSAVTNDTRHLDAATSSLPLAREQAAIISPFLREPQRVLDFGCGAGELIFELASALPSSNFFGCDLNGPALEFAERRGSGLANMAFGSLDEARASGPFDVVIMSHVVEHFVDFDQMTPALDLLRAGGLLYVEVPDALAYETHGRLEYLYYFDRTHVNHFTERALSALFGRYFFGLGETIRRTFTYRDGAPYPALCMAFRKGRSGHQPESRNLRSSLCRYMEGDRQRCDATADALAAFPTVMVWGAGDNFHRSVSAGGPLGRIQRLILLDRKPMQVTVGGTTYLTQEPEIAIRNAPWPVVITISEHRTAIEARVADIDATRAVFCI